VRGSPASARWRPGAARVLARHRRLVAALLLAVAAGVAVDATAAEPPAGVPAVAAAADLPAGAVLGTGDLTVMAAPAALVPPGAVDVEHLLGRRLAGPVRQGAMVTDADVLGPGLLVGQPANTMAMVVRPSETPPSALVRPGDRVQVLAGPAPGAVDAAGLAGGRAEAVVSSATVLAVPDDAGGGLLGEASSVLVVAVTRPEALALTAASDGRWLSVAVLP